MDDAPQQFHFDPDTYLAMIREEVPDYDTLQAENRPAGNAAVIPAATTDRANFRRLKPNVE